MTPSLKIYNKSGLTYFGSGGNSNFSTTIDNEPLYLEAQIHARQKKYDTAGYSFSATSRIYIDLGVDKLHDGFERNYNLGPQISCSSGPSNDLLANGNADYYVYPLKSGTLNLKVKDNKIILTLTDLKYGHYDNSVDKCTIYPQGWELIYWKPAKYPFIHGEMSGTVNTTITLTNVDFSPKEDKIDLSLSKDIVSTKVSSEIIADVKVENNASWTLKVEGTNFTKYGVGSQSVTIDSTEIGEDVTDGKYPVTLTSGDKSVSKELKIDNTPPVIKKTDIDSNGNLQITAYDPTVNLISSGLEEETKDLQVDYGKNKRENIQLSIVESQMGISSLTATDTSKILKKGIFSAEIKDKVGNIFKYNNNCATDGEAKKKEVEDKLKPLKNIIEQNSKEVNNLKVKFEATLQEYNTLVTQGKALDSTLTQLETQLNLSQQKLDELNANNEDDLADEYEQLTKTTEMLAEQAKEADNQISKINNQLDNKSKNLDELKNKINQAKSEVEASNNQVNNLLNSLDGVCLASALGTAIGQFVGPLGPVVIAVDITIDAALIINSMYVNSLIAENKAYSQQEAQKSKSLREKTSMLAKSSKEGEHYPDRVAKEFGLTKKERHDLGRLIEEEKKSQGRGGKNNLDLETIRDFAKEILDKRKG